jgi:hypothetical protein
MHLQKLGKDADINSYSEAEHGFANPSGTGYNRDCGRRCAGDNDGVLSQHLQSE